MPRGDFKLPQKWCISNMYATYYIKTDSYKGLQLQFKMPAK